MPMMRRSDASPKTAADARACRRDRCCLERDGRPGGRPELLRRRRRGRAPLGQLAADGDGRAHARPALDPDHAPVEARADTGPGRLPERARRLLLDSYGIRVVVSVYGLAADAPRTPDARSAYCSFVADLLRDNPEIDDVAIWNDPNDGTFWVPQFGTGGASAAPADYEALLAQCYDAAHAVRKSANVIAVAVSKRSRHPGRLHAGVAPAGDLVRQARRCLQGEPPDAADLRHARLHPAPGQLRGAAVDEAPRRLGDLARRLRDADVDARRPRSAARRSPSPARGRRRSGTWRRAFRRAPDPGRIGFTGTETDPSPRAVVVGAARRPTRARGPVSTRPCSSRTRSGSPTASPPSARTSTSTSTTSATSPAGSPACSGPTASPRPPTGR